MPLREQRHYPRGKHFAYEVRLSQDGEHWHAAQGSDLSSGGMKLLAAGDYTVGQVLQLDVLVQGFMVEFRVASRAEIRRKAPAGGRWQYGIAFLDLTQDEKIRIDENVRQDRPITGQHYHPE